eukprot:Gb_17530 [translate_table: standard]
MASKALVPRPPEDAHLQFTDTLLGKEIYMGDVIRTYSDLYREVEKAEQLYSDLDELSEEEDQYKSDLLSLKALGLHLIATKPKDLYRMPEPDLVYDAESVAAFLRGKDLVKGVLRDWAEDLGKFKRRASVDYPISHFRKGIRIGMVMLNRLWGMADTDHVNQHWAPLLGEIILNDRKSDFAEILTYNLHQNWEVTRGGKSFFISSYMVDACCAFLNFGHSRLPEWPHPSGIPIHLLFDALHTHKYQRRIITICDYFYPMVYKTIRGIDMPRLSARVRDDLSSLGAWWFFEDFTVIRVEGVLTAPTVLPIHVPHQVVAYETGATSQTETSASTSKTTSAGQILDASVPPVVLPSLASSIITSIDATQFEASHPSAPNAPASHSESSEELDSCTIVDTPPQVAATQVGDSLEDQEPLTITSPDSTKGIHLPPLPPLTPPMWRAPSPLITIDAQEISLTIPLSDDGGKSIMTFAGASSPTVTLLSTESSTVSRTQWLTMQLAKAEATGGATPKLPEVTLEYNKSTSNLKKVTKRKVKTGSHVTTLQTEENLLSLTRKRKRGARSIGIDDEELIADPVSIVKSVNKMFEEAVERMQSFIRAEEARGRGEETHRKIEASLENMDDLSTKLVTLGNVAWRNQLPDLSLLGVDEVATCESVLARTKQALEDGSTPLVASYRQLEASAWSIKALLDNAGLPLVRKPDSSILVEAELDAMLESYPKRRPSLKNPLLTPLGSAQITTGVKQPKIGERTLLYSLYPTMDKERHIYSRELRDPARLTRLRTRIMERNTRKEDPERNHVILHSPSHEACWEAYLMAKEVTRNLRVDIANLGQSVNAMRDELQQIKSATQSLGNTTTQILHGLSPSHGRSCLDSCHFIPKDEASST